MTSKRPYQRSYTQEQRRAELEAQRRFMRETWGLAIEQRHAALA